MSMTSKDLWAHVCRTATLILKEVIIWILQNYSIFQSLQFQMSPVRVGEHELPELEITKDDPLIMAGADRLRDLPKQSSSL
jgi:uncharacterized protein (DUF58 family)